MHGGRHLFRVDGKRTEIRLTSPDSTVEQWLAQEQRRVAGWDAQTVVLGKLHDFDPSVFDRQLCAEQAVFTTHRSLLYVGESFAARGWLSLNSTDHEEFMRWVKFG